MSITDLLSGGLFRKRSEVPDTPKEDFLNSAVSREPPNTADEFLGIDLSGWGETFGFSANVSKKDLKTLTDVAEDPAQEVSQRFTANHLLEMYYMDQGDVKRAFQYSSTALRFATSHSEKATCYFGYLLCMQLIDERDTLEPSYLPVYDEWVAENLWSILEGDISAIQDALDYAEGWHDYGLAAAAALAWSTHPENTDPLEREEAEAAYHRLKKQFEVQAADGYSDVIYTLFPDESRQGIPCRAKVRLEFLRDQTVHSPQELMERSPAGVPSGPKSYREIKTDELMERVKRFVQKYPLHDRTVYNAEADVLREYIDIGCAVMDQLELGNVPLMRAIMGDPEAFQDMGDFILLNAVLTLWFIHPENTEGRADIEEQKRSGRWFATSVSLHTQFDRPQLLEKRLQDLGMPELTVYQSRWSALAAHVQFEVYSIGLV